MRCLHYMLVLATLLIMRAPVKADRIVSISLRAFFTCQSSCNMNASELGDESLSAHLEWNAATGTTVPGTISVTASGDLGSLSFLTYETQDRGTMGFFFQSPQDDQVALFTLPPWNWRNPALGEDGTQALITCGSRHDACSNEGFSGFYPLKGSIFVAALPEASTWIYFATLLICVGVAVRRSVETSQRKTINDAV